MTTESQRGEMITPLPPFTPTKYGATSSFKKNDDFLRLQESSKLVLNALRNDENTSNADLYRRLSSCNSETKLYAANKDVELIEHLKFLSFPNFLKDELNKAKFSSLKGLMAEANLAWLSVDDKVFIWSYDECNSNEINGCHGGDFCSFTSPSGQCIVSVGIVPAKAGVFKPHVKWCLVITTPDEAIILAIILKDSSTIYGGSGSSSSSIELIPTPFHITTDLTTLLHVKGTSNGRIFLGGYDGCLYEMTYTGFVSPDENKGMQRSILHPFFLKHEKTRKEPIAKKCRKINHSTDGDFFLKRLMPSLFLKIASNVTGNAISPIVDMVVDNARFLVYTLSSLGILKCYKFNKEKDVELLQCVSTLNVPSLAKQYLQSIVRSWGMNGSLPNSSSSNNQIQFAGGGNAILSNIHGIEGARRWIQAANDSDKKSYLEGNPVLCPISIHILENTESNLLSLTAITRAGLRYYFINHHKTNNGYGTWSDSLSCLVLCQIKSPPLPSDEVSLLPFKYDSSQTVSTSYLKNGIFLSALDMNRTNTGVSVSKNIIQALLPDYTVSNKQQNKQSPEEDSSNNHSNSTSAGLCEFVSYYPPTTSSTPKYLSGGTIWRISSPTENQDYLLLRNLFYASTTPSDSELGLFNYFPPPAFLVSSADSTSHKIKKDESSSDQSSLLSNAYKYITNVLKRSRDEYSSWSSSSTNKEKPKYLLSSQSLALQLYRQQQQSDVLDNEIIPKWMKSPSVSSLNYLTSQHLSTSTDFTLLTNDGIHFFQYKSILQQFHKALCTQNASRINAFFEEYGYEEGCIMALYTALSTDDKTLSKDAVRAALTHANLPKLEENTLKFEPSSLCSALITLVSRIFRPFWLKPILLLSKKTKNNSKEELREVQFLIPQNLLSTVRQPLFQLQQLMCQVFGPAIQAVPCLNHQNMEIDDEFVQIHPEELITRAIQLQQQYKSKNSNHTTSKNLESQAQARFQEEVIIHNLYRIVTRSVQFWNIISILFQRQLYQKEELEWGLLHGIPCMHLITTQEGHDRIQSLLLHLVASCSGDYTDGKHVSTLIKEFAVDKSLVLNLAEQCYLYFSLGDQYAFQGFESVNNAKKEVGGTNKAYSSGSGGYWATHASLLFRKAARYWKNPSLVLGLATPPKSKSSSDEKEIERIAVNFTSPVAKAAAALYSVGQHKGIVDLCLVTASNFGGTCTHILTEQKNDESIIQNRAILSWEVGLYHRSFKTGDNSNTLSLPSEEALVITNTNSDNTVISPSHARITCYFIIFYYLRSLLALNSSLSNKFANPATDMISYCVENADVQFLYELYEYLFQHGYMEYLLNISSGTLEEWLSSRKDFSLLYSYFIIHGRTEDAGELMLKCATDNKDVSLSIQERVEYLARSLHSFHSSTSGPVSITNTKVRQVQDFLDSASIQKRILSQLMSCGKEVDESILFQLKNQLLDISTLLNEYATRYSMYDLCLVILNVCKYSNTEYIQALWKFLFCSWVPMKSSDQNVEQFLYNEFRVGTTFEDNLSKQSSFDDCNLWLPTFQAQFVQLGKELWGKGADYTFPIGFLIQKLSKLQFASRQASSIVSTDLPWALIFLLEVNVPHIKILEAFSDWFKELDHEVGENKQSIECLTSIAKILSHLMKTVTSQQGSSYSTSSYILSLDTQKNLVSEINQALASGLRANINEWKAYLQQGRATEASKILGMFQDVEDSLNNFQF